MKYLIILIFIFSTTGQTQMIDMSEYLWKKRLLLVKESQSELYKKQLELYAKDKEQFQERDLIVLSINNEHPLILNWPKDNIFLVGKDGTVKRTSKKIIESKKIFDQIDAMPMRKSQMKQ